jgi:hypothetical protein
MCVGVTRCIKRVKTASRLRFSGLVLGVTVRESGQNTHEFIMSLCFIFINNISGSCVLSVCVCINDAKRA